MEQGLQQEAIRLEDQEWAREETTEATLGEGGVEAKKAQGLEGPRKELLEGGRHSGV